MPLTAIRRAARHRSWRAAALAALILASSGCGRPGPPFPANRVAPPAPPLLRGAGLRLPLDAYLASPAEVSQLTRGRLALLRRCMGRYGFDYPPPAPPAGPTPRSRNERRYGLTDPAAAAVRGYRLDNRDPTGSTTRPAKPAPAAFPPGGLAVLTGAAGRTVAGKPVPPDGCAGEASRELSAHAPPGADTGLPQRLSAESFAQSRNDPEVQAATRQWANCMKTKGLDYASPFDPPGDPRFRGPLSRAETTTATTDVACKRRTNLVGIWFTAESTYQRTLIDNNPAAVEAAAAAVRAQLAAARKALSG
jgi:hypothetical protein